MTAREALLQQGKVSDAMTSLQGEVRAAPNDPKLRVFLFQLMAVLGQWERAATQLKVCGDQDDKTLLMVQVCGPAIAAEILRAEIFAGKRSPLLLGEPEEWIGWLLQANKHLAEGHFDAAREFREKAFEAAPPTSGTINGQAFEWISDADQRFGPMLEAIVDGKYYWIPFHRIREITIEAPTDLRDVGVAAGDSDVGGRCAEGGADPDAVSGDGKERGRGGGATAREDGMDGGGRYKHRRGAEAFGDGCGETPLLEARKIILNQAGSRAAALWERGIAEECGDEPMAEINPRDKMLPFLLDRLTDDMPGGGAARESREKKYDVSAAVAAGAASRSCVAAEHGRAQ